MSFGTTIALRRKALGLSQKELASRIYKEDDGPISPQYLNDLERDRRNPPSQHLLREFARELELPGDYLAALAGELPDDIREALPVNPERVEAAFQAFRRHLKEAD
jgi:transcriptional regulator with XRE-family HTH domain